MTEILPTKKGHKGTGKRSYTLFHYFMEGSTEQAAKITHLWNSLSGGGVRYQIQFFLKLLLSGVPDVSMETVSIRMESLILFLKHYGVLPFSVPIISANPFHLMYLVRKPDKRQNDWGWRCNVAQVFHDLYLPFETMLFMHLEIIK